MAAIRAAADTSEASKIFSEVPNMNFEWLKPDVILGSLVYAVIGVAVFWVCFLILDKITPYHLWQELVEKQNLALGIVVAAMSLGICIIVAAAIH
jgi:putative membrane protein